MGYRIFRRPAGPLCDRHRTGQTRSWPNPPSPRGSRSDRAGPFTHDLRRTPDGARRPTLLRAAHRASHNASASNSAVFGIVSPAGPPGRQHDAARAYLSNRSRRQRWQVRSRKRVARLGQRVVLSITPVSGVSGGGDASPATTGVKPTGAVHRHLVGQLFAVAAGDQKHGHSATPPHRSALHRRGAVRCQTSAVAVPAAARRYGGITLARQTTCRPTVPCPAISVSNVRTSLSVPESLPGSGVGSDVHVDLGARIFLVGQSHPDPCRRLL